MKTNELIILLDLDGVLITTPPWRQDIIDSDGYSAFNQTCVENLNTLIELIDCKICLSSNRRTVKTLPEFKSIFTHRNIKYPIDCFLPEYENCSSRKDEIIKFIKTNNCQNYLIIDDDKSLHDLPPEIKQRWVQTELMSGFGSRELQAAIGIIGQSESKD